MGQNIDTEILACLVALASVVVIIAYYKKNTKIRLPPGPYGLPFVGYAPFLRKKDFCLQVSQLGKKYGPLFSVQLGRKLCIILSNSDAIKEAFVKNELNGAEEIFKTISVFGRHDEVWTQHRRFLAHCLRELSAGGNLLQENILNHARELVLHIVNQTGCPVNIYNEVDAMVINMASQTCFGKIINPEDKQLFEKSRDFLKEMLEDSITHEFTTRLMSIFIAKRKINTPFEHIRNIEKKLTSIIRNQEHELKVSDKHAPLCIMSMYLDEVQNNEKGSKYNFNGAFLVPFLIGVYQAALSATGILARCFYVMADKPDVQFKVQEEIDQAIGRERMPAYTDRKNMPYTHSVLLEVQRFYSSIFLSFPKVVLKDTVIMGYKIPKDAFVQANFHQAHRDESIWENPNEFLPGRFNDLQNANSEKKSDNIFTFSYGKRHCPGDMFAQMQIFLLFVCILQKFNIQPAEGKPIDLEVILTAFYMVKQQNVCFTRREVQRA